MNTLQVRRSLGEAEAAPDPSWRGLYKVGGVSGVLVGVLYIVATVLVFIMPQPPISGGAATLQYIASNRSGYILELVLYVGPSVLVMVVFLALYMALKHLNKSYAALGAIVGIASEVIALALNSSPPSLNGG